MIKEYFIKKKQMKEIQEKKEQEMLVKITNITNINIKNVKEKEKRKREMQECTILMNKLSIMVNENLNMKQLNNINKMVKKYFYGYKLVPSIESRDCYEMLFKLNRKITLIISNKIQNNMNNNIFDFEDMNYVIEYGSTANLIEYRDFLLNNIVSLNFTTDVETLLGLLDRKLSSKQKIIEY